MNSVKTLFANRLLFWLRNARYHTWKQSFIPGALALLLCLGEPGFSWFFGLLAVFGVVLAHMSANLLDDYFDYQSGSVENRQKMLDGGIRARSHKCHYLTDGTTTMNRLFLTALLWGALGGLIGSYLFYHRGLPILYCFLSGAFLSFFYSAPPFRLSFHGLGELTVSLLFGPILMTGVVYSACGHFVPSVTLLSCSIGLLVGNVLYTHSILDLEPDRSAGKKTLAVLLGNKRRAVIGSALFQILIYLPILIGVCFELVPLSRLLVFLSVPLSVQLWFLLALHATAPERKIHRTFWMGPMENWDKMVQFQLDWFMIRWYLSRNLLLLFCLLLAISVIMEK